MMQNASLFQADSIIFDLEDAVALKDKDSARILLNHFIKQEKLNCEMIVRINGLDTNDALKDLDSVVLNGVDTIMLPKADVASLRQLDSILTQYELTRHLSQPIKVIPIIELAMSLLDVRAIASSPRVDGLLLGAEDFTKDIEVERSKGGLEIQFARNQVAVTAKAYKIDAIDTPFTDTNDENGLKMDCQLALQLAMNAKACIHPNQVSMVNVMFSPSKASIQWAKRVVEAANTATEGAFSLDGKMIDKPIIERSEKILAKARKFDL